MNNPAPRVVSRNRRVGKQQERKASGERNMEKQQRRSDRQQHVPEADNANGSVFPRINSGPRMGVTITDRPGAEFLSRGQSPSLLAIAWQW